MGAGEEEGEDRMPHTWALLLVAGLHLLATALAGVALHAGALAHAEAALPARVAGLGAEAPVVPRPPLAVSCGDGGTLWDTRLGDTRGDGDRAGLTGTINRAMNREPPRGVKSTER